MVRWGNSPEEEFNQWFSARMLWSTGETRFPRNTHPRATGVASGPLENVHYEYNGGQTNTCQYCGEKGIYTNCRGGRECAGCGAPR